MTTSATQSFIDRIHSREARIGIVGLGYVGIPLMLRFVESGFHVLGIDIDAEKLKTLSQGKSPIRHIPDTRISDAMKTDRVQVTTDFALAAKADALIICVPTPLSKYREPDLSYITDTMDALMPHLRRGQVVSLESTTYPGTTQEEIVPRVEKMGFKVGHDVMVVFSPEREDPGNAHFNTRTIPKVVGGSTADCLKAGVALYSQVIDKVVPVSSTQTAEMTKLLENIYRAVNIGLVNELKTVSDKMGIDIWEVISAASTKPFGFTPFYPGPGLGGHCIPIDPFYLTWKAREYKLNTHFIELAGQVNTHMPEWVVSKVTDALNAQKKSVNGSKILVLGAAYKKNIDDARESPSLELIALLQNLGATVSYADPYIPKIDESLHTPLRMNAVIANETTVRASDCVLVVTDHDDFDYAMIRKSASLIVDTRGRFRPKEPHIFYA